MRWNPPGQPDRSPYGAGVLGQVRTRGHQPTQTSRKRRRSPCRRYWSSSDSSNETTTSHAPAESYVDQTTFTQPIPASASSHAIVKELPQFVCEEGHTSSDEAPGDQHLLRASLLMGDFIDLKDPVPCGQEGLAPRASDEPSILGVRSIHPRRCRRCSSTGSSSRVVNGACHRGRQIVPVSRSIPVSSRRSASSRSTMRALHSRTGLLMKPLATNPQR